MPTSDRINGDLAQEYIRAAEKERAKLAAALEPHGLAHLVDAADWDSLRADAVVLLNDIDALWARIDQLDAECDRISEELFESQEIDLAPGVAESLLQAKPFDPHGFFVYVLFDNKRALYVGQSINVLSRLGAHMTRDRRQFIHSVRVYRCANRSRMDRLEIDLIRYYSPPWNTVHVPKTVAI